MRYYTGVFVRGCACAVCFESFRTLIPHGVLSVAFGTSAVLHAIQEGLGSGLFREGCDFDCLLPYLDGTHSLVPRTSDRAHAHVFSLSVPRLLFILECEDVEP